MSVLVASWVLTFLTLFALAFSYEARVDLKLTRLERESVVCRSLARSGVEMARAILRNTSQNEWDSPLEGWDENPVFRSVPLGSGYFSVGHESSTMSEISSTYGVEDEGRRIPLWEVDRRMLDRLQDFEPGDAKAILDFVGKDGPRQLARPEAIPGLSRRGREAARRYFSLHATGVNLNTATPEVLRAIGIPEDALRHLLSHRDGPDGKLGTADDQPFTSVLVPTGGLDQCALAASEAAIVSYLARSELLAVSSDHYHVRSRGWLEEHREYYEIDAVLERHPNGEMAVVEWRESWNP
jgi:hypothetical protein